MDFYLYPRNGGILQNPDFIFEQYNLWYGNNGVMQGLMQYGRITQLMFAGQDLYYKSSNNFHNYGIIPEKNTE